MQSLRIWVNASLFAPLLFVSCTSQPATAGGLQVIAVETFLADIAQHIAGDRFTIRALLPVGMEPHAFQPAPQDFSLIADCDILILNGSGMEDWFTNVMASTNTDVRVIEASAGLESRHPADEMLGADVIFMDTARENETGDAHDHGGQDPHFWLDPISVIRYAENIRDGFIAADPEGAEEYHANTESYIINLRELDAWIRAQVEIIPPERRLLVTNHEALGYFADRYGFTLVGAVIPSSDASASASAQQIAALIESIRATGAPAVFLEQGASRQLADQIAAETGIRVITGLLTHSVTVPEGEAPSYIEMMRFNVRLIVAGLGEE